MGLILGITSEKINQTNNKITIEVIEFCVEVDINIPRLHIKKINKRVKTRIIRNGLKICGENNEKVVDVFNIRRAITKAIINDAVNTI